MHAARAPISDQFRVICSQTMSPRGGSNLAPFLKSLRTAAEAAARNSGSFPCSPFTSPATCHATHSLSVSAYLMTCVYHMCHILRYGRHAVCIGSTDGSSSSARHAAISPVSLHSPTSVAAATPNPPPLPRLAPPATSSPPSPSPPSAAAASPVGSGPPLLSVPL